MEQQRQQQQQSGGESLPLKERKAKAGRERAGSRSTQGGSVIGDDNTTLFVEREELGLKSQTQQQPSAGTGTLIGSSSNLKDVKPQSSTLESIEYLSDSDSDLEVKHLNFTSPSMSNHRSPNAPPRSSAHLLVHSRSAPPFEPQTAGENLVMWVSIGLVTALTVVAVLISIDVIDWPGDGIGLNRRTIEPRWKDLGLGLEAESLVFIRKGSKRKDEKEVDLRRREKVGQNKRRRREIRLLKDQEREGRGLSLVTFLKTRETSKMVD